MDGRKNVSISHILPGGRYASAADSWISPWTARSDRGPGQDITAAGKVER